MLGKDNCKCCHAVSCTLKEYSKICPCVNCILKISCSDICKTRFLFFYKIKEGTARFKNEGTSRFTLKYEDVKKQLIENLHKR